MLRFVPTCIVLIFLLTPLIGDSSTPDRDKMASISRLLDQIYSADRPGASILVKNDKRILFQAGYGLANVEHNSQIRTDTPIGLGSVTKQFTAMAILLLVQEGALDLDAKASQYLDKMPTAFVNVRIRQLLSHTSGLPDFFSNPKWFSMVNDAITPTAMIELMGDIPLTSEPGSEWRYSNFNYMVLAAVIEAVSSTRYGDFMEQRIFSKLSMNHSFLDQHDKIIPGRATGYEFHNNQLSNAHYMNASHFSAAGALMSSVEDMALWHDALRTGKLIRSELVTRAYTPVVLNDGSSSNYGFGWNIEQFLDADIIWHSGSGIGYETTVMQFPNNDNLFIAVLNNSPFIANSTNIARRIAAIMMDQAIPEFSPEDPQPEALLGLQGRYIYADGQGLDIRVLDEVMQYRFDNNSWNAFVSAGKDTFYRPKSLSYFKLKRDSSGKIVGLIYTYSNQEKVEAQWESADVELPPNSIAFNESMIRNFIGTYDLGAGNRIKVSWVDDHLYLQIAQQKPILIVASSDTEYFSVIDNVSVKFEILSGDSIKINVQERYPYSAFKTEE